MNNFTKDELKALIGWYNNSDTREYQDKTKYLFDKVQSMIENHPNKTPIDKLKEKIELSMFFCKSIGTEKADTALWAYQNVLAWIKEVTNENQ